MSPEQIDRALDLAQSLIMVIGIIGGGRLGIYLIDVTMNRSCR